MTKIKVKEVSFKRRSLPEEYAKRYDRLVSVVEFKILKLTDRVLNTFPVELIDFENKILKVNVKESNKHAEFIVGFFDELQLIEE